MRALSAEDQAWLCLQLLIEEVFVINLAQHKVLAVIVGRSKFMLFRLHTGTQKARIVSKHWIIVTLFNKQLMRVKTTTPPLTIM